MRHLPLTTVSRTIFLVSHHHHHHHRQCHYALYSTRNNQDDATPLLHPKATMTTTTTTTRRSPPPAIVFPPDPHESGRAVVNRIFRAYGLLRNNDNGDDDDELSLFDQKCLDYIKDIAIEKDPCQDESLHDYTCYPFITIDNDDSTDLDQAMWISRRQRQDDNQDSNNDNIQSSTIDSSSLSSWTYRISYALADGVYFCPAFSPLFQRALHQGRATSFYLPGKMIPMLPRVLSENLASLNPHVKRRALVFDMYLDTTGEVTNTEYKWCIIQSRWKGSYRAVSQYYQHVDQNRDAKSLPPSECSLFGQEYTETLDLLRVVGRLCRNSAKRRNVVDYNRDTSVICIDEHDNLIFTKSHRLDSELYNEQISLLCNTQGAKILNAMDTDEVTQGKMDIVHPIFRTQSQPRREQVQVLGEIIRNTLKCHGVLDPAWIWNPEERSIASYLDALRQQTQNFINNGDMAQGRSWNAILQVVERQAMMTNVAASFTTTPANGHYALKLSHYARFSSPMRELVGCFTHKELWEGHRRRFSHDGLDTKTDLKLRKEVIRAAQKAKERQKQLSQALFLHMLNLTFYRDLQMKLRKRPLYNGVLLGMEFSPEARKSRRCYVKLDEPSIEIKVSGEDLDFQYGCRYAPVDGTTFGRHSRTAAISPTLPEDNHEQERSVPPPTFRVGQRVSIQVADYAQYYGETQRSRWIFFMNEVSPDES